MEFRQQQLANGLEVIAEVNPRAYSTALGFFVNAGSRDETEEIGGVSHFLEHMVFKGTPRRSAEDVNRELDELGSASNARTSEERTIYHATVLPEFQNQMVDLLSDILRPSLRTEDFEMEKQVIIEEIHMYDDQPPFGGHERIMANFFADHPLGRSVLGTVDTVGQMTPEAMRTYFEQRYSPGNIVLVASGNVDFEQLVSSVDQHCGSWTPFDAPRRLSPATTCCGFETLVKEHSTQVYLLQLCDGPAGESSDRFASRVLATIVGDDSGSRMFWEFIDTGIAEYAGMGAYEYQVNGVLMTVLVCAPESAQENLEKIASMQQKLQREGITEHELELAKRKISAHVILQSERAENRLFAVGSNWMQRREYKTVREIADAYQAVTLDDLHRVLEQYPLTDNFTLAVSPHDELKPVKA